MRCMMQEFLRHGNGSRGNQQPSGSGLLSCLRETVSLGDGASMADLRYKTIAANNIFVYYYWRTYQNYTFTFNFCFQGILDHRVFQPSRISDGHETRSNQESQRLGFGQCHLSEFGDKIRKRRYSRLSTRRSLHSWLVNLLAPCCIILPSLIYR